MLPWEVAERRYQQIKPRPGVPFAVTSDSSPLMAWLRNDVVPGLPELVANPQFQELATWTLRMLAPGVTTRERALVERLESTLLAAATATLKAAEQRPIRALLRNANPPRQVPESETVEIGAKSRSANKPSKVPAKLVTLDLLKLEIRSVRQIVERDSKCLVVPEDFFQTKTVPRWCAPKNDDKGAWVQQGELLNRMHEQLLPIGDLVVRGLQHRITNRLLVVTELRNRINRVCREYKPKSTVLRDLAETTTLLEESRRALERHVFNRPNAVLCDSCVILTQVYASFHPAPNLEWLDLPSNLCSEAAPFLGLHLRGSAGGTLFDRIARALADMRKIEHDPQSEHTKLARAIAAGGLVIAIEQSKGWWDGKAIDLGRRGDWAFLTALAGNGRNGTPVTERDIYPLAVSKSAMATRWNRLGRRLPSTLSQLVKRGKDARSYILNLSRDRIHLFD